MLSGLPQSLSGIQIEYLGKRDLHMFTDEHIVKFKYKKYEVEESIRLPKPDAEDIIFINGKMYFPVPCLAKPILLVDKEAGSVTVKSILTDFYGKENYDLIVGLTRKGQLMYRLAGRQPIFECPQARELEKVVLRTQDRADLNAALNLSTDKPYLTEDDVIAIEHILLDKWEDTETTNWKPLGGLRVCLLWEMLSAVVCMTLPRALNGFKRTGEIYPKLLTSACKAYMHGSSQCQLIEGMTGIARLALLEKIALPIHPYDGHDAADPHNTWFGYIDSLTTPQSEKCGQIVSLCNGVAIEDGRLVRG